MTVRKLIFVLIPVLSLISCTFVSRLVNRVTGPPETIVIPTLENTGYEKPQIINHTRPDVAVDIQSFTEARCSGENLYVMECAADSPIRLLGCDFLNINNLTGGLVPAYPVANCLHRDTDGDPPDPTFFKPAGCLMPQYQAVVIGLDGEFRLISDLDEYQVYFAPVESEAEALSYAQLVTGLNAVYGRQTDQGSAYTYRVDRLEDTHVVSTDEGFVVSLFSGPEPMCGCGTHTFYQRDVLVRPDGQVEVLGSTPLYDMEACFD